MLSLSVLDLLLDDVGRRSLRDGRCAAEVGLRGLLATVLGLHSGVGSLTLGPLLLRRRLVGLGPRAVEAHDGFPKSLAALRTAGCQQRLVEVEPLLEAAGVDRVSTFG